MDPNSIKRRLTWNDGMTNKWVSFWEGAMKGDNYISRTYRVNLLHLQDFQPQLSGTTLQRGTSQQQLVEIVV